MVTVQRALGHAQATTTLTTYSHLWPTADDRTRNAASALFSKVLGADVGNTWARRADSVLEQGLHTNCGYVGGGSGPLTASRAASISAPISSRVVSLRAVPQTVTATGSPRASATGTVTSG